MLLCWIGVEAMAKFNPAMLVPSSLTKEFAKESGGRTIKDVVLANIEKMKAQWAAGDKAEGKLNYRVAGERVCFTIRVSNQALVLGTFEDGGVTSDVREMTVPKANFAEALDFYAERIRAGDMDAQLATLDGKKAARTEKLRATRAGKKGGEAQPAK